MLGVNVAARSVSLPRMPPICSGGKTCARGAVLPNTTAILRSASANGQASPAGWRAGDCLQTRNEVYYFH